MSSQGGRLANLYYLYSLAKEAVKLGDVNLLNSAVTFFASSGVLVAGQQATNSWLVGSAAGVTFVLAGAGLVIRKTSKRRNYLLNQYIDHVTYRATYRKVGQNDYVYERHYKVRALRNDINNVLVKYHWTGQGPHTDPVTDRPDLVVLRRYADLSIFSAISVDFSTPLRAGDVAEFTITTLLKDTGESAKNFLEKTIEESFPKGLTLCVEQDHPPRYFERQIFIGEKTPSPIYRDRHDNTASALTHEWKIPVATIGRRYRIVWD